MADPLEGRKKHIEWAQRTINPIKGCNGPGGVRCDFCFAHRYALRFGKRWGYAEPDPFIPEFFPDRLKHIRRRIKPMIWFFGSMTDWLDNAVKPEWREACLKCMAESPRHIFITLTKQYKNLWKIAYDSPEGKIPSNVWVGISVCFKSQVWGISELAKTDAVIRFASFEPLKEDMNSVRLEGLDWIIIGAQSMQTVVAGLPAIPYFRPKKEWVQRLAYKAKQVDPPLDVFLKPNLRDYVADGWFDEKIEEMPIEKYLKKKGEG